MVDYRGVEDRAGFISQYFSIGWGGKPSVTESGLIDVNADVILIKLVDSLQVNFGEITGNVVFCNNILTTLKGCPSFISGQFKCNNNRLTSLVGGPITVTDSYNCSRNPLTSLEGLPKDVGHIFALSYATELPLLRLISVDYLVSLLGALNTNISVILQSIKSMNASKKQKVWHFQEELIKYGHASNARF
jgi:hypothetical protein